MSLYLDKNHDEIDNRSRKLFNKKRKWIKHNLLGIPRNKISKKKIKLFRKISNNK